MAGEPYDWSRHWWAPGPQPGNWKSEKGSPRRRRATRIDILGYVAIPGGPWILVRTFDERGYISRRVKSRERVSELARHAKVRVLFRHHGFQLELRPVSGLDTWPYDFMRRRTELPFWRRSAATNRWHVVRDEDPYRALWGRR